MAAGPVSSVAGTEGAWTRALSATEPTTASTQPTNGTAVSVLLAPARIKAYFWHDDFFVPFQFVPRGRSQKVLVDTGQI